MFTCTYTSLTMWKIALWTGFLTPIHLSWNIATAGSKFVIWLFFIVAMFFSLMDMVLTVFQCFPYHQHSGFQLDQHSSQFVVPPVFLFLHATPCRARYFHRMEILRSIFLCPRRVGASASPNGWWFFESWDPTSAQEMSSIVKQIPYEITEYI